jgi:hypothetical protein
VTTKGVNSSRGTPCVALSAQHYWEEGGLLHRSRRKALAATMIEMERMASFIVLWA